jgi:O-antigen/teichoic acid export membrane protein
VLTATIGSFAVELVYLVLAVVAFRLIARRLDAWWQYAVVAVAAATPILGFYGALNPLPHNRSNYNWEAAFWTIGVLVVVAVWFSVVLATRRSSVDNAAAHAAEHRGVPPLDETLDFEPAPPDTVVP